MRLQLDGRDIDLHSPNQLMAHLGNLRAQPQAALRIELDDHRAICLEKDGDRAVVRYASNGTSYLARCDGEESWDVPVMLAYQAVVHFLRDGGMTGALEWQAAA